MTARPLLTSVIVAAAILSFSALLKAGQHAGMIDAAMAQRVFHALMGLLVNLLSDFIYTMVDPRIDFETREV